ncbi:hypothetical protein EPN18_01435 [bacterium]|nr:MAG: hypothetical protein EPN18_01435 [bacterium]
MNFRKLAAVALIFSFSFFAFSSRAVADDTTMQATFKDTVYGGLIGALIGSAFVLLSNNPSDHLEYIPTGAAVGMIGGAIYGIATSGGTKSIVEIEHNKVAFNVPTIKHTGMFDKTTNSHETVGSVGIMNFKF